MEGEWHVYLPGERWRKPAHLARAVLGTPSTVAVGFELGQLDVVPTTDEERLVGHLGPDLLGPDWDAREAVRRIERDPQVPIAVALLDQRNLAGLGNEYVNELCFLRGMLPTRPVGETDVGRAVDLGHRLIAANRDRGIRTTTGDTRRGRNTWVYGREHEACRRCGTPITVGALGRDALSERITYVCPHCQR
jgi:endonuclease-8